MSVTNCAVMMGSVMLKSKSAPDSAMEDPATIALPRTVVTMAFEDLDSIKDDTFAETTAGTATTFEEEEDDEHRTTDRGPAWESLSVDIIVRKRKYRR